MPRYLVIANQTLNSPRLRDALLARHTAGRSEFHIVVPATRVRGTALWTEGQANAHARTALEHALANLQLEGIPATGNVGDDNPVLAVSDALRQRRYDEIIISTLPLGVSRWLKRDLPHRLARRFGLPVTHITAPHLTPIS